MTASLDPRTAAVPSGGPPTAGGSWERYARWLATGAILAATTAVLHLYGRQWWCACGQLTPWVSDTLGPHNSQHLLDPYSFIHVLHGLLFFCLFAWAFPRLAPSWRLCLAVALSASWELFENSEFVIQRYRDATASAEYAGDTIANSLGDILSCALGFGLASRLGFRGSVVWFLVTELVLLLWIRDNLLLTIVMLVCPFEGIKAWQTGG
jgi:Protein of unknown function (DUF2585)